MPDAITRLNAALEGRYLVERELGEGGMATVYLAKDLKHNRNVALKVLKPDLAAVVGAERFLAEIETTANLQHPHILPLFDSGEADTFLFYVMPYVEGEDLRQKLDREHQLPVADAVHIATNMAEALDYAHRQGVVHRDIKPANVLLLDGKPVIADFGIALAVGVAGGGRLTETGLSIGTPFYMSPEQATGDQHVGPPSDTYALAAMLYEMLTGDPPFIGSTAQAVLGKIIQGKTVSATEVRQSVPPNVDAAIRKGLEKLPADRFAGAADFAKALADPGFRHGENPLAAAGAAASPWNRLTIAMTVTAALFAVTAGWAVLRPEVPMPQRVERFVSPFGMGEEPVLGGGNAFDLAPDGSLLVYYGEGDQLWVRRWDDLQPSPVRGTETSFQPTVSPDGQEVAFNQGGEIKVVSLVGGPVRTLMPGNWPRWGADGYVYANSGAGVARVPGTGGPAEPVYDLVGDEAGVRAVGVLPGGETALIEVGISGGQIRLLDLESGETSLLTPGTFPRYAPSGHLVYLLDGQLMAARFDAGAGALVGPPVALEENVAAFSLSDDGKLFLSRGGGGGTRWEFVWVTRSGQATPVHAGYTFTITNANRGWRLSPDETRIAFNSEVDGTMDVRIKHLPDGPEERITFTEAVEYRPIWTPDGQSVTYFSGPNAQDRNVWMRRADGTGEATLVLDGERSFTQGVWSLDGEWLILRAGATAAMGLGLRDILAFRPGEDSDAVPLVATTDFAEGSPELSPDGQWLAYASNETGRDEVFLRPFPDVNSGRVRVSTDGGLGPLWSKDGRELFYVDESRGLVRTQIDLASGQVLTRESLFTIPAGYEVASGSTFYDISRDGDRFLMARLYTGASEDDEAVARFVLVQNFFEELRQRVPN